MSGLSNFIAKEVFELGGEHGTKCHRVEFKGGDYPDNEIAQGGLNEIAFSTAVDKAITSYFTTAGMKALQEQT